MKAKVRTYRLIPKLYDSIYGTLLEKEDLSFHGQLNIIWDEKMYIEFNSGFDKELLDLFYEKYHNVPITKQNCYNLENELNNLLNKYRNKQKLFLETDLCFTPDESMILLGKDLLFNEY